MRISHLYEIETLEEELTEFLLQSLTVENFLEIFSITHLLPLEYFSSVCAEFLRKNGDTILEAKKLEEFSQVRITSNKL